MKLTALKSEVVQPLLFPCLMGIGKSVLFTTKREAIKFRIRSCDESGRLLFTNAVTIEPSFAIDRRGSFRRLRIVSLRRRWARSFAWFVDLVLAECELLPGIHLTNGQILHEIRSFGGHASGRVIAMRRFLGGRSRDQVFDEAAFREFYARHCPRVDEAEWLEQYP